MRQYNGMAQELIDAFLDEDTIRSGNYIPKRTFFALIRNGRHAYADDDRYPLKLLTGDLLSSLTDEDLIQCRNIGVASVKAIREFFPYRKPIKSDRQIIWDGLPVYEACPCGCC